LEQKLKMTAPKEINESHHYENFKDSVFEASETFLAIIGVEGHIKKVNPSFQKKLGYPLEELIAIPIVEFIHADDKQFFLKDLKKALETKTLIGTCRIRTKLGGYLYIEWKAKIDEASGLIFASATDITDNKLIEISFKLLYQLSLIISQSAVVDEVIEKTLATICENLSWELGQTWMLDPQREIMQFHSYYCSSEKPSFLAFVETSKKYIFPKGIGLSGQIWQNQNIVWYPNLQPNDTRFIRASASSYAGFNSAIAFPIRTQNHLLAVMEFYTKQVVEENSDITHMLETVGYLLGEFLLRKEAEKKASIFVSMVQNSDCGIIGIDTEGNIFNWNEGACRLYQYTADEVIGKSDLNFYPQDKKHSIELLYHRVANGEEIESLETVRKGKNGFLDISLTISPIKDPEGKVIGISTVSYDITKKKKAELGIKRMHALQQAILDSSIYMVISTDLNGVIQIFNKSAEKNLGYKEEEVVGKQTPIIFHDVTEIKNHAIALTKELRTHVGVGFETFIAKAKLGIPDENEWTYIRKDGSTFSVMLCTTPLYNVNKEITGYVGIVRDISERKQFQQSIKESEERFHVLFENATDSIVTMDTIGTIHSFNRASEEMFQYTLYDIWGKSIHQLIHDKEFSELSPLVHSQLYKKFIGETKEIEFIRKNGELFPAEVSISQMTVDGAPWLIWIIRDITERKKLERMKNEFVSTVSHELRTPLTSIKGSLGLVLAGTCGDVSSEAKNLLEIAQRNSDRLVGLINDILDLEKIASGSLAFKMEKCDLVDLIAIAIESNKPFADQYGITLEVDQPYESLPIKVDGNRLIQVITNLISNAVKFSPTGDKVIVKVEKNHEMVRVSIIDHGPGIPKNFHSRIFEKFAQADASDKRKRGGTGLGLSISKMIIEKFGGQIGFRSEENKGSTFYFELPQDNRS